MVIPSHTCMRNMLFILGRHVNLEGCFSGEAKLLHNDPGNPSRGHSLIVANTNLYCGASCWFFLPWSCHGVDPCKMPQWFGQRSQLATPGCSSSTLHKVLLGWGHYDGELGWWLDPWPHVTSSSTSPTATLQHWGSRFQQNSSTPPPAARPAHGVLEIGAVK